MLILLWPIQLIINEAPEQTTLGPELMFAESDKYYPSRSEQTSLATSKKKFHQTCYNDQLGAQ